MAVFDTAEMHRRLAEALPGAIIRVQDMTGTGDHFAVVVVSDAFQGKPEVARHRMVYAPLRDVMGGAVHALALTTQTDAEAQAAAASQPLRIQP